MKKIAIIGAGYTGLALAKRLVENNEEKFSITIYEKENEVGGMVRATPKLETNLDRHYRHIFKSDKFVIDLAEKFNIDIIWPETKMGYFTKDRVFEFGTPISLLKFKPLNFFNKIRFGLGIISLKLNKNWKKLEKITAEEYVTKHCGKKIYSTVWEPLLTAKFGKKKSQISMAWLWGKIALRSSSTSVNGERLGYIKGSYKKLTDALYEYLLGKGCKIVLNSEVRKVRKVNNKYIIESNHLIDEEYDIVISTISNEITKKIYEECLLEEEKESLSKLEYSLARTLIIISEKPLTKFYWINIGQEDVPFGGIIEQTNLLPASEYKNSHIIYISNYMYEDDELYKYDKEKLLDTYMPALNKINPDFTKDNVKELLLFEDKYAQPIIKTNYSKERMEYKFKEQELYMANMSQIYPEDRGMNYAIRLGYDVADTIINKK